MRPTVGERRIYEHRIEVLYPGERATAHFTDADLEVALRGEPVELRQFLVEPEPGLRATWRRWRYRLIGQWVERWHGGRNGA